MQLFTTGETEDDLLGYRSEFPVLASTNYLISNSLGDAAPSLRRNEGLRRDLGQPWHPGSGAGSSPFASGQTGTHAVSQAERIRAKCHPGQTRYWIVSETLPQRGLESPIGFHTFRETYYAPSYGQDGLWAEWIANRLS